jgi:SPP1 family predicted phage head-tail adaptor
MQAGKLRHRLAIMRPSEGADSFGQPQKTYGLTATVWGSVEPLSGRELFTAQQVAARVTHKITIRGRTELTPKDRVQHRGRAFELDYVMDVEERRIVTEAYAVEVPA